MVQIRISQGYCESYFFVEKIGITVTKAGFFAQTTLYHQQNTVSGKNNFV
jgi:hypothetical protein